jgi:hypothetical protein
MPALISARQVHTRVGPILTGASVAQRGVTVDRIECICRSVSNFRCCAARRVAASARNQGDGRSETYRLHRVEPPRRHYTRQVRPFSPAWTTWKGEREYRSDVRAEREKEAVAHMLPGIARGKPFPPFLQPDGEE